VEQTRVNKRFLMRLFEHPASRDLFLQQCALSLLFFLIAIAASYWQHGFLIGGSRGIPLAGSPIDVPIWHLLLLGLGAGYLTALVGQATGIISLPYAMSVLHFSSMHISPTVQVETLINPIGALMGYRKQGQWNRDLAVWPSLGAVLGANLGPLLRVHYLADKRKFQAAVGTLFVFLGVYLYYGIRRRSTASGPPQQLKIITRERNRHYFVIQCWDREWRISVPGLFVTGFCTALAASAIGMGGGFLLVPLMTLLYHLPMHLLVAASIPFVLTQSAVSLFSYGVVIPSITGQYAAPEWAWGFFVGSTATLGSWCGAMSQRYFSERVLSQALGLAMTLVGIVYVVRYFF
jgi:hypothetical protein